MTISIDQFTKMWNKHCFQAFGLSSNDSQHIMSIKDFWSPNMTLRQANAAMKDMHQYMQEELHFDI
jgi:hypothetical protein